MSMLLQLVVALVAVMLSACSAKNITIARGVDTGAENHAYSFSPPAIKETTAKAMVATNLGGWFVLEPWITPSLFYRFLDMRPGQDGGPAMDSYSLCESLGPVEGNKLMRAHYDSWYTEDTIAALAARKIEMIRVPIGDWTLDPYGPYKGCMDGAKEKIDWLYDTAAKYGLKVLLDVHAMKGSQNGFDNSGQTKRVTWQDDQHFSHWPDNVGEWQGEWDSAAQKYTYINQDNIQWSLTQAEAFMKRWGAHEAFYAYEPVNEPWWNSDMDTLFSFYRDTRKLLQQHAPQAIFCFHDAFQYNADLWNTLFADGDTDKVVLDHHYYQAWNTGMTTTDQFCDDYENNAAYADAFKYPVWFGEWALSTDVCAHWLGGFNDGNTNPQFQCQWVDCPVTYLPPSVAVDFNRTAYILGPFGTGNANNVCIQNGKCSSDSMYFSDAQVNTLAKCAYKSFDAHLGAHIMWTAHNEIEVKWDYIRAYDKGWLQTE